MKRLLLYSIIAAPALPLWFALGAVGIPLGVLAGFMLLLTIEASDQWRQGKSVAACLVGVTDLTFRPWRYRLCSKCGKFRRTCRGR
jgi:hypothetical protein